MGRWRRAQDDAAPGSGPDESPKLPPLRLHAGGEHPPEEPVPSASADDVKPLHRWLGFGLAVVVGIVAGVVGANARHDAVERARVELIGGQTTLARPASSGTDDEPGWEAEFLIFNPGQQPVEIIDVHVDGWTRPNATDTATPVSAPPGVWTTFPAEVMPDCEVEPTFAGPDASLVADTRIRTENSEETIPLMFAPGQSWLRAAWTSVCVSNAVAQPEIAVVYTEMLPREEGIRSVRARLHLATATGEGAAAVIRIWSHVPGFGFAFTGLPAGIEDGQPIPVELEWEVASCEIAERLDEARLSFHVSADVDSTAARVQSAPVPAAILVGLGRLSAEVCGL